MKHSFLPCNIYEKKWIFSDGTRGMNMLFFKLNWVGWFSGCHSYYHSIPARSSLVQISCCIAGWIEGLRISGWSVRARKRYFSRQVGNGPWAVVDRGSAIWLGVWSVRTNLPWNSWERWPKSLRRNDQYITGFPSNENRWPFVKRSIPKAAIAARFGWF